MTSTTTDNRICTGCGDEVPMGLRMEGRRICDECRMKQIVAEGIKAGTVTIAPCPNWCVLPRDHDPADALDGGRVHYAPIFWVSADGYGLNVTFTDNPENNPANMNAPWWCETVPATFYGVTPGELAGELRDYAQGVLAAAKWLEERS